MPTYQYACKQPACGHRFEAVQSFSDDPITACPVCEGLFKMHVAEYKALPEKIELHCPDNKTASATLRWIMERVFLGNGVRRPSDVVMRFFEVM